MNKTTEKQIKKLKKLITVEEKILRETIDKISAYKKGVEIMESEE